MIWWLISIIIIIISRIAMTLWYKKISTHFFLEWFVVRLKSYGQLLLLVSHIHSYTFEINNKRVSIYKSIMSINKNQYDGQKTKDTAQLQHVKLFYQQKLLNRRKMRRKWTRNIDALTIKVLKVNSTAATLVYGKRKIHTNKIKNRRWGKRWKMFKARK